MNKRKRVSSDTNKNNVFYEINNNNENKEKKEYYQLILKIITESEIYKQKQQQKIIQANENRKQNDGKIANKIDKRYIHHNRGFCSSKSTHTIIESTKSSQASGLSHFIH